MLLIFPAHFRLFAQVVSRVVDGLGVVLTERPTTLAVWVTANWYNERGETGAACSPISINLPASVALPSGEKMKIAA